jgi:hypothetical protein
VKYGKMDSYITKSSKESVTRAAGWTLRYAVLTGGPESLYFVLVDIYFFQQPEMNKRP